MFFDLMRNIKGSYSVKAVGRFPERILNIASTTGIYIYDVHRLPEGELAFSMSKKGYEKLAEESIEGVSLVLLKKQGFPVFFKKHHKRIALFLLPAVFLASSFVFSRFVWKVEVVGGTKDLRELVMPVLRENGVYVGAPKKKIDLYNTKRNAITKLDSLAWMWVDIKGTNAKIKIQPRTPKPLLLEIAEPADVISLYSGVVEKMQVYCGIPLVKEGETVEKGQTVVTGTLRSENENIPTYYHHARADIILRVNSKKTVVIPKKSFIKKPTGNKKTVFSLNFKKNNVKFSLNSGISYTEYDKIEKTFKIPFTSVSFLKTTYLEAEVVTEDNDTQKAVENHKEEFIKQLEKEGLEIKEVAVTSEDTDSALRVTFNAECFVKADKEIPITKGE